MLVFISSPYSHPHKEVMTGRAIAAGDYAAFCMGMGLHPFSPIAHWHNIADRCDMPTDAGPWMKYNREMLRACDCVHVLCIDGWRESKGVGYELQWASDLRIPVWYARPDDGGYILSNSPQIILK